MSNYHKMLPGHDYLYYIPIALQGICAYHSYKHGTQQKWIYIIIFLPVIGSLVYIYQEILRGRRLNKPSIDVRSIIDPNSKLKKLEDEVRFTNTFANRVKLADAYLAAGYTDKAIEIYLASLTGAFSENEHVQMQLIIAYYQQQRYQEILPIAKRLYKLQQFARSKAHLAYAEALEYTGNAAQAEAEYKLMKGRYSYFEQRYYYGLFLMRQERYEDAEKIFEDMLEEQPHLSAMEKKASRVWFAKAKEEFKRVQAALYAK